MDSGKKQHSLLLFILFPAVAMLLGWGLRGYIGGGPYGAMIPGCFVAICIALLLGYKPETAAMAAVFGTAGIGIGGEMTYGQTLGFLHNPDTIWWGVLGCIVKGGVWGLLGGAILGLGLTRDRYDRKSVIIGLLIIVVAFQVGRELINEPKLLYFSDREDRPRDESWAGLLFGATALLAWMRSRGSASDFRVPLHFALFGCVGGALGFGGGCLFLAYGFDTKWIGWWKMMEFSFGFILGGALGLCAYLNRDELAKSGQAGETPGLDWKPVVALFGLIVSIFASYLLFRQIFPEGFLSSGSVASIIILKTYGTFVSFPFVAAMAITFGLYSLQAAWQFALTITFFHCVYDFTRDLDNIDNFGFTLSTPMQWLITIALIIVIGIWTYRLQRGKRPVPRLLLLAVGSCYAVGCARSFINLKLLQVEGKSYITALIDAHPSIIFVHGTFTVSAILTVYWTLTKFKTDTVDSA